MKEIQLTQGKKAIVDDDDYEKLNKHKWNAHFDGKNFYAQRHTGRTPGKDPIVTMHKVIMDTPHNMECDHKDGNGLNNQRDNLRICTRAQNSKNRKPTKATSILKGVGWCGYNNKWRARINSDNKSYHLGVFNSEIDAAIAYDKAAIALHGEFARTNYGVR